MIYRWMILFSICTHTTHAMAGPLTLRLGPPGVGSGGTNPMGIPPGIVDADLSYVTASKWEGSISIAPGILVGKRFDFKGPYTSAGGALVLSGNGVGPGVYSAFGYDFGSGSFRFNMEYKQALGITKTGLIAPYALRMGVSWY